MRGISFLVILLLGKATKINASVFECVDDSVCADNGKCIGNKCECEAGKNYNSLGTKCLDLVYGYGQPCNEREMCALLRGSYACSDGKCVCDEGWVYLKGKCMESKKLSDPCNNDEQCFDGMDYFARKCIDNKCECNVNYYNRKDLDCRKRRSIGESCSINLDCAYPNGACKGGICIDTNSPPPEQRFISLDEEDEPIPPIIGKTCETDANCPAAQSHCSPLLKKCFCNEGYFQMQDACVPELGSRCNAKQDCVGLGVDCINNVCTCTDRYQHKEGNMRCLKVPFADDFWCSSNEACKIFGKSFTCDSEKKCVCLPGFSLNADTICKPSVANEICKSDMECNAKMKNSICDPTGACVCRDKFEYNSDTAQCEALLGGTCGSLEDCMIENSICKTKCTCADSFVQNGDKNCIHVVPKLHEKCSLDIQCASVFTGSYCANNRCECQKDYLELDGVCLKKPSGVGDVCNNKKLCDELGDAFVCRYGVCQCAPNAKPSNNGKLCKFRNSGASKRVWPPMVFGGVAIVYSMIVGVFL